MLYAVAQLTEDVFRNIRGTLGDEIDAHALGTNQADHLFYLVEQSLGSVVEQHVGLIEEEYQLRHGKVADLGQGGVEF